LLNGIDRGGLHNVRLIRGDGVDVLEHLLAPGSLTGVRVFFPDPWPKARHHKRRLLQSSTVALIADRLRPGGVLHAATDHAGYAEQIAEVGDAEPLLRRVGLDADHVPISVSRPVTKYEAKAQNVGSAVTEFLWEKAR
jgi:tRNA (guanine-N7-)-methyltransferase